MRTRSARKLLRADAKCSHHFWFLDDDGSSRFSTLRRCSLEVPTIPARVAQKDLRLYVFHDSGHLATATKRYMYSGLCTSSAAFERTRSNNDNDNNARKVVIFHLFLPILITSPVCSFTLRCTYVELSLSRRAYSDLPHQPPTFIKHTNVPPTVSSTSDSCPDS